MDITFSLELNIPFFKDFWGYKSMIPASGVRYGVIKTTIDYTDHPSTRENFSYGDQQLCNLLNNETLNAFINVSTTGAASADLLKLPGAIGIDINGITFPVNIELLKYTGDQPKSFWDSSQRRCGTADCNLKLANPISDLEIQKNRIELVSKIGYKHLQALKLYLGNPEKYYFGKSNKFIVTRPETLQEFIRIYDFERPHQAPAGKDILLDPCLYTENEYAPAVELARLIISGLQ